MIWFTAVHSSYAFGVHLRQQLLSLVRPCKAHCLWWQEWASEACLLQRYIPLLSNNSAMTMCHWFTFHSRHLLATRHNSSPTTILTLNQFIYSLCMDAIWMSIPHAATLHHPNLQLPALLIGLWWHWSFACFPTSFVWQDALPCRYWSKLGFFLSGLPWCCFNAHMLLLVCYLTCCVSALGSVTDMYSLTFTFNSITHYM